MSPDISIFFGPLLEFLKALQKRRHAKEEKQEDKIDEALEAIYKDLIATKKYIKTSEGQNCGEIDQEMKLATLWSEASVKTRHVNDKLALQLNDKHLYWSDDVKWSRKEVLAKKIDLDSIQKQVESLLRNS